MKNNTTIIVNAEMTLVVKGALVEAVDQELVRDWIKSNTGADDVQVNNIQCHFMTEEPEE